MAKSKASFGPGKVVATSDTSSTRAAYTQSPNSAKAPPLTPVAQRGVEVGRNFQNAGVEPGKSRGVVSPSTPSASVVKP